jgi:hypothetical protein
MLDARARVRKKTDSRHGSARDFLVDVRLAEASTSSGMTETAMLSPGAFFTSRAGVCVYVTVRGQPLRVCFASLVANGRAEVADSPHAREAIAIATRAFHTYHALLVPLFDAIANSSQVPS